jgi:hypothetical protein
MSIKVKATERGYFKDSIREEDEVFFVETEAQIGSWMEVLDAPAPAKKANSSKPSGRASKPAADAPDDFVGDDDEV